MEHLVVITTSDLVALMENALNYDLPPSDIFELFEQLFQLLDGHSPLDMTNRNILIFDRFIFTNHLTVDRERIDRIAYNILVKLYQRLHMENFYVGTDLMYFPFVVVEKDLAVRRYNS